MTSDLPEFPALVETPRLEIRQARSDDAVALGEALSEALDDLVPYFSWARSLRRWTAPEDLAIRLRSIESEQEAGRLVTWLLWERERPDRVVGEITLRTEGRRFGVLTYLVWLRPSAFGRGLATEGSRALLERVLASGETQYVEAECAYANHRSRKLLTRLGFRPWGATRDHERLVLVRDPEEVPTGSP